MRQEDIIECKITVFNIYTYHVYKLRFAMISQVAKIVVADHSVHTLMSSSMS